METMRGIIFLLIFSAIVSVKFFAFYWGKKPSIKTACKERNMQQRQD